MYMYVKITMIICEGKNMDILFKLETPEFVFPSRTIASANLSPKQHITNLHSYSIRKILD